jgi:hypothetical protein
MDKLQFHFFLWRSVRVLSGGSETCSFSAMKRSEVLEPTEGTWDDY